MSNIKGIFFRNLQADRLPSILKEIYIAGVYSPYFQDKKDLTILDLGAHIGMFSFYAQPFAKIIYAIEPAKEHFEALTHMIMFNNFDNIRPIKAALTGKGGTVTLLHTHNRTMFSVKDTRMGEPTGHEQVEAVTIDALFEDLKLDHVDFMKLDIEGSEMDVICGAGFDKVSDKIDVVMGENHSWNGTNPHQLEAAFQDRGFKFSWIPSDAQLFVAKR